MYWKAAVLYLESTSGVVWQAERQSCLLDQAAPHQRKRLTIIL